MGKVRDPSVRLPPIELIRGRVASQPALDVRLLPRTWQRIGHVLLIRFPKELKAWKEFLAPIYADVLRVETVVEDVAGIQGPWRVPEIVRIWGGGTETEHRENGVRFKLDVAKVMLSSGNLNERMRIARIGMRGETVVDLFAGIGYFSLPIAVHARPSRIIACEVNPTAYDYLMENIRLNRAGVVEPRLGDCRGSAPKGIADRVIMGHFEAEKYLDVAFDACKASATLHVHGLSRLENRISGMNLLHDTPPETRRVLQTTAERHGYRLADVAAHFVKWYGPHRAHIVVDASVLRN